MSLFVPVQDPASIRKDLLLGNKSLLGIMRKYQSFNELRQKKQQAVHEFISTYHELGRLMRRLKGVLPKADVPTGIQAAPYIPEIPATASRIVAAKPKSKLDVLEEQLSKIERKLTELQ